MTSPWCCPTSSTTKTCGNRRRRSWELTAAPTVSCSDESTGEEMVTVIIGDEHSSDVRCRLVAQEVNIYREDRRLERHGTRCRKGTFPCFRGA